MERQNPARSAAPPICCERVDPADCAQGFVWLALVFASHLQTSEGAGEGDWLGSLRGGAHHSDTAKEKVSASPVRAGPRLWLVRPRLSSRVATLSSCTPRAA